MPKSGRGPAGETPRPGADQADRASATATAWLTAISRGCPASVWPSSACTAPVWPSWPCEMITGWVDASSTAMVVSKLACAQSATMPSRLHSATTSRPNRLRPAVHRRLGLRVAELVDPVVHQGEHGDAVGPGLLQPPQVALEEVTALAAEQHHGAPVAGGPLQVGR